MIRKIIKSKISLAVILFAVLASCDQDAFLDEVNPNTITTSTFWNSESQFDQALTTVYGALQFRAISGTLLQHEMILGDIAGTESWYRPFAFRNLTYNNGTYYVTDKWNELYIGIFRANQVIQYAAEAEDAFSEGQRELIEGQARFLRAFYYFQLVHSYGGAVIHTKVAETKEDFAKPFSTIEEVNNSIIIPDLEYAIASLPEQWTGEDVGRATWGAAMSMLGKVYLYDEDWTQAASKFKEVIDSGNYSLTADIMDNFTHENEHNSESIFEVAFSSELNPGAPGDAVDDTPTESGAEATSIAQALGQLNFGAFNTLLPSYYLHELFTADEMDPSDPQNIGRTQSARMSATIVPIDGDGLYYDLPIGERGGWAFGQSAYVKKQTNWYHLANEDGNGRSGINFRHIRLADVYLMYAEAVVNASGDFTTAIEYIDMIRDRAGVKTLAEYMGENGGTFPQLHVSLQVNGSRPYVSASAETVLTHIQRVERPLELCFEGHRWKDLVRWGIVKEVFQELRQEEIWREQNQDILDISGSGVAPLYIRERVRPDFNLSSENYLSEQHDYFPIPTQEIQTNPQIGN